MENAITAGLSKQIVLTRALDVAANNVANQTTAGFKAERLDFREFLSPVTNSQTGNDHVSLVSDADTYTDFSPGGLQTTNAPLDFAINGDGFFAVQTDNGIEYTRDGHFGLNDFGELITRDGQQVLDDGGGPILIDPDLGALTTTKRGDLQQNGATIARLGVFGFDDNAVLRKVGNNRFIAPEDSLTTISAVINQGVVEASNVSPVTAVTEMIEILRAYESAAAVVETSSDLSRDAVRTLTQNI